jgi:DNA polymerase
MLKDTRLPLRKGASNLVFGVGNPDSDILLIGEGPGYWEDQKGEPFVGNAGKLLDQLLASIGLSRDKVYITNVVHHRPPSNRDPLPEEIKAYGVYLDKIISIIDPAIIVTLGRFSMAKFLPDARISSVHGKGRVLNWNNKRVLIIPMYHPAAALRSLEIMEQEKLDFLRMKDLIERYRRENSAGIHKSDSKAEQISLI